MIKRLRKIIKNILRYEVDIHKNESLKKIVGQKSELLILGSAPSINLLNLNRLDDKFIISTSNFHEHKDISSIKPDIHVFAASHEPITNVIMYNWFVRCNDRLPKTTLVLVESRDRIIAEKAFKERKLHFYSYGGKLPVDFNKPIISPWSVAVVALQLGIFLNIKEIYLLGIDHDWQSLEDYAHFYSHEKESLEYFASKENVHFTYDRNALRSPKSRLYREYELYQQYELLGEYASNLGIKIFNGDRSSGFDVYNHSYNWMR